MRIVYIILIILFISTVLLFSVQNFGKVTVTFISWSMTLPLALIVILSYIFGMVSGGSLLAFLRSSIRGAKKKTEKNNA